MPVKQLVETRIIRRKYIVTVYAHMSAGAMAKDLAMVPADAVLIEHDEHADGDLAFTFEQERLEPQT